jgi:hypothetical protein
MIVDARGVSGAGSGPSVPAPIAHDPPRAGLTVALYIVAGATLAGMSFARRDMTA